MIVGMLRTQRKMWSVAAQMTYKVLDREKELIDSYFTMSFSIY